MNKMSGIAYSRSRGTTGEWGLLLPRRVWVFQEMVELVYGQARTALPTLEQGVRYTACQICDEALWAALKDDEPQLLGRCLRHLVRLGKLPLQVAMKRNGRPYRGGKLQYQLM